jgi:hypothetical protein
MSPRFWVSRVSRVTGLPGSLVLCLHGLHGYQGQWVNHIILPMLSTTFGSPGSMVLDLMSRVYGLGSPGYPDYPGYPVTRLPGHQGLRSQTQVTQVTQVTRISGLRSQVSGLQVTRVSRLPRLPGSRVSRLPSYPSYPGSKGLRPYVSRFSDPISWVSRLPRLPMVSRLPGSQVSMVSDLPSHHPQIHGTGLTSHLAIGAKTTLLQYAINGLPACLG